MKSATAVLKNGKIYVQGYSETTTGIWVATGPVFVSNCADAGGARASILNALSHSAHGVPHPLQSEWKDVQTPMLKAVGAKSWKSLAKDALAVSIKLGGDTITFTPSVDYENNGGRSLPELACTITLTDGDLGAGLICAFEACS